MTAGIEFVLRQDREDRLLSLTHEGKLPCVRFADREVGSENIFWVISCKCGARKELLQSSQLPATMLKASQTNQYASLT